MPREAVQLRLAPEDLQRVGQRLVHIRRMFRLSQTELARRLRIDLSTLSKWESGDREPNLALIVALCDGLDLSLDFIYRGRMEGLPAETREKLREQWGVEEQTAAAPPTAPRRTRPASTKPPRAARRSPPDAASA